MTVVWRCPVSSDRIAAFLPMIENVYSIVETCSLKSNADRPN